MPIFFTKKSCNRGVEPTPQMPLTVNKMKVITVMSGGNLIKEYFGIFYFQVLRNNSLEVKKVIRHVSQFVYNILSRKLLHLWF